MDESKSISEKGDGCAAAWNLIRYEVWNESAQGKFQIH